MSVLVIMTFNVGCYSKFTQSWFDAVQMVSVNFGYCITNHVIQLSVSLLNVVTNICSVQFYSLGLNLVHAFHLWSTRYITTIGFVFITSFHSVQPLRCCHLCSVTLLLSLMFSHFIVVTYVHCSSYNLSQLNKRLCRRHHQEPVSLGRKPNIMDPETNTNQ